VVMERGGLEKRERERERESAVGEYYYSAVAIQDKRQANRRVVKIWQMREIRGRKPKLGVSSSRDSGQVRMRKAALTGEIKSRGQMW
jgi:hypothetical protein